MKPIQSFDQCSFSLTEIRNDRVELVGASTPPSLHFDKSRELVFINVLLSYTRFLCTHLFDKLLSAFLPLLLQNISVFFVIVKLIFVVFCI